MGGEGPAHEKLAERGFHLKIPLEWELISINHDGFSPSGVFSLQISWPREALAICSRRLVKNTRTHKTSIALMGNFFFHAKSVFIFNA